MLRGWPPELREDWPAPKVPDPPLRLDALSFEVLPTCGGAGETEGEEAFPSLEGALEGFDMAKQQVCYGETSVPDLTCNASRRFHNSREATHGARIRPRGLSRMKTPRRVILDQTANAKTLHRQVPIIPRYLGIYTLTLCNG